jgi:MFS family permease
MPTTPTISVPHPVSETPTAPDLSFRGALKIPAFRNLWIGQAISQLGDALYYLVFLFMIDKLTGNALIVGLAGAADTLPFLGLALYAGVIADRMDRRRILLLCDVISAVVLLLFAILVFFNPKPPAVWLIAAGFLLSTINVFFAPAKSASIPQLVPSSLLPAANSLSMTTQNVMPLLGIALSGTILALLYAVSPTYFFVGAIVLNACSFAFSAIFIRKLPPLIPEKPNADPNVWKELKEGIRYIRQNPTLATLVGVTLLVSLSIAPFMLVYVTVNRQWFGGAYWTLALCESSFFAAAILGGIILGQVNIHRPGLVCAVSMAIFGATIAFMAFSHLYFWFVFWNVIAGLAFPFSQIPITTYIQRTVPNHYQGRVNSVLSMVNWGVQPLAIGLGGLLLSANGSAVTLLVMGVGMTLGALSGLISRPFRTAEMP